MFYAHLPVVGLIPFGLLFVCSYGRMSLVWHAHVHTSSYFSSACAFFCTYTLSRMFVVMNAFAPESRVYVCGCVRVCLCGFSTNLETIAVQWISAASTSSSRYYNIYSGFWSVGGVMVSGGYQDVWIWASSMLDWHASACSLRNGGWRPERKSLARTQIC